MAESKVQKKTNEAEILTNVLTTLLVKNDPAEFSIAIEIISFLFRNSLQPYYYSQPDAQANIASLYVFCNNLPVEIRKKVEDQLADKLLMNFLLPERIALQNWFLKKEDVTTFMRGENLCQRLAEKWPERNKFDQNVTLELKKAFKEGYDEKKPKHMRVVFEKFLNGVIKILQVLPYEMQILLQITIKELCEKNNCDMTMIDNAVLGMFFIRFINPIVLRENKTINYLELSKAIQKITSTKQDNSQWETDLGDISSESAFKFKSNLLAELKVLRGRKLVQYPSNPSIKLKENACELLCKINSLIPEITADALQANISRVNEAFAEYKSSKNTAVAKDNRKEFELEASAVKRFRSKTITSNRLSDMFVNVTAADEKSLRAFKTLQPIKDYLLNLPTLIALNLTETEINTKEIVRSRSKSIGMSSSNHIRLPALVINNDSPLIVKKSAEISEHAKPSAAASRSPRNN